MHFHRGGFSNFRKFPQKTSSLCSDCMRCSCICMCRLLFELYIAWGLRSFNSTTNCASNICFTFLAPFNIAFHARYRVSLRRRMRRMKNFLIEEFIANKEVLIRQSCETFCISHILTHFFLFLPLDSFQTPSPLTQLASHQQPANVNNALEAFSDDSTSHRCKSISI